MWKITKKVLFIAWLVTAVLLVGCEDDGFVLKPAESTLTKLLSAPVVIEVSGYRYFLDTYMWRDFMPITPSNGTSLSVALFIGEVDEKEIPSGLVVDQLWVINGNNVWATDNFYDHQPNFLPYMVTYSASGGPKWGPDINVDAVVRLKGSDGIYRYLKAEEQQIYGTE